MYKQTNTHSPEAAGGLAEGELVAVASSDTAGGAACPLNHQPREPLEKEKKKKMNVSSWTVVYCLSLLSWCALHVFLYSTNNCHKLHIESTVM